MEVLKIVNGDLEINETFKTVIIGGRKTRK